LQLPVRIPCHVFKTGRNVVDKDLYTWPDEFLTLYAWVCSQSTFLNPLQMTVTSCKGN
jgi:hypothetical protein